MATVRRLFVRGLQTTGLNRVAHRVYYGLVQGFGTACKALQPAMERCVALAAERGLLEKGDYCEFGIFKGRTLWHVQDLVRREHDTSMRFFGFDSFEGLPAVNGPDETEYDEFYAGQFACSIENVRRMMTRAGTDWNRTFLIKGYFCDSLTDDMADRHQLDRIAMALVDCDLYASTIDVLNFLDNRLVDGAIVVMDDWGCFRNDESRGQQLAMREFLDRSGSWRIEPLFRYGSYGQVFSMHRVAERMQTSSQVTAGAAG